MDSSGRKMSSIIDLTGSSPEPDESPGNILKGFLPRKTKQGTAFQKESSGSGLNIKPEASPLSWNQGARKHTVPHNASLEAVLMQRTYEQTESRGVIGLGMHEYIRNGFDESQSPQPGSFYTSPDQTEFYADGIAKEPSMLLVHRTGMEDLSEEQAVENRIQSYNAFRAKQAPRRLAMKEVSESHLGRSVLKRGASTPPDDTGLLKRPRPAPSSGPANLNSPYPSEIYPLIPEEQPRSDGTLIVSLPSDRIDDNVLLGSTAVATESEPDAAMLPSRATHACRLRFRHMTPKPPVTSPQTNNKRQVLRDHPSQLATSTSTKTTTTTTTTTLAPYTTAEDVLLVRLKSAGLSWDEIASNFPTRSRAALQTRYSTKLKDQEAVRNRRAEWYHEDDSLLLKLKNVDHLSWKQIALHFPERTSKAVENRYFKKFSRVSTVLGTGRKEDSTVLLPQQRRAYIPVLSRTSSSTEPDDGLLQDRRKPRRSTARPAADGFVSWTEADQRMKVERVEDSIIENSTGEPLQLLPGGQDRVFPSAVSRILRERVAGRRFGVSDELKNHVFANYRLKKYFEGTSGDVHCLAWHPDGNRFAAGSIAVSDPESMQYNRPLNLLAGATSPSTLLELQENYTDRPVVDDSNNPNALHAMRETQDPRLFMSVSAICFDTGPKHINMYTTGYDKKVHVYTVGDAITDIKHRYEIHHSANIDLLDVNAQGLVATGCTERQESCVNVFQCNTQSWQQIAWLAPRELSQSVLLPRALRWGTSHHFEEYLLAGFASQPNDGHEGLRLAGAIGLWSITTDGTTSRFKVNVTRNVFDVAWNPMPTSASTMFIVACAYKSKDLSQRIRSAVQSYSPTQLTRPTMTFQCPASDINDVMYCPYDSNLVAAGATDGRVYVWDLRFASHKRLPLHVFAHQESLNVLPHDQDREAADTGVRFLSWGATSSRLYSGSSDGIVKVWNPYRSSDIALVDNLATFGSAIMSGSFCPDYSDLLIGEEKGRLNLLSIGHVDEDGESSVSAFRLSRAAKQPSFIDEPYYAAAQDLIESGEIEYKPMGTLPLRQAVQGPGYAGPFFSPTAQEWLHATTALTRASGVWERLKMAHDRAQLGEAEDDDDDDVEAMDKASARVENAENRIKILQLRQDEYPRHRVQARTTQQAFLAAEANLQPTLRCALDCNYLPSHTDGEREDSNRSAQRIPHALRAMRAMPRSAIASALDSSGRHSSRPTVNIANMTCSYFHRLGLAPACPDCARIATTKNAQLKAQLERMCKARLQRLKASFDHHCVKCGAPVIPSTHDTAAASPQCERCNFACPRCSSTARISARTSVVECESCGRSFKAGVLGYELCDEVTEKPQRVEMTSGAATGLDAASDEDDEQDLGIAEMEHYASLWGRS